MISIISKILVQRVPFSVDMKHYLFCSIWYQSRGFSVDMKHYLFCSIWYQSRGFSVDMEHYLFCSIWYQCRGFSVDMKHYQFCSIWYQSRGLCLKWNSVRSPKNSKYFIEYCCCCCCCCCRHHWLLNNTPQYKQDFPCNRFDVKSIAYTAIAATYRKILWKKAILANISPSIKL